MEEKLTLHYIPWPPLSSLSWFFEYHYQIDRKVLYQSCVRQLMSSHMASQLVQMSMVAAKYLEISIHSW